MGGGLDRVLGQSRNLALCAERLPGRTPPDAPHHDRGCAAGAGQVASPADGSRAARGGRMPTLIASASPYMTSRRRRSTSSSWRLGCSASALRRDRCDRASAGSAARTARAAKGCCTKSDRRPLAPAWAVLGLCRASVVLALPFSLSYPHVLVSVPMPSTHTFTTSPGFRNSLLSIPTPDGVPVRIRSPGRSVRRVERCEICSASVKIILVVCESCLITSLTDSLMPSFCGSAMASAGTIQGPSGQAPSKHFWLSQSYLNGEVSDTCGRLVKSRAERSLPMV